MNQTIEQYLRIYCNYQQDNWSQLLSLAEFAYNNAFQASIKCSPFFATYGYHPQFSVHLGIDLNPENPAAKEYAECLQAHHDSLIENVKSSQDTQASYYDAKHKHVEFAVRDKVWLLSPNIRTEHPSKKLDWKRLGPYVIEQRIGLQAYRLKLSPSMKIHPVFHVSLLDPYKSSAIPDRIQDPPPPVVVDYELEWEVEEILYSRLRRRRLFYKVCWKNYPPSDDSWQPASDLTNSPDLVDEFHSRYPNKPGSASCSRPRSRSRSRSHSRSRSRSAT
jgi:hypothetical protein